MAQEQGNTPPQSSKTNFPHVPLDSSNELDSSLSTPAPDESVEALRKQSTELSPSAQAALDLHIAKTFLKEAPTLFGTLANATFPATMQDAQTVEVQSGRDYSFRTKLLEERNTIHQLVLDGKEIASRLSPAVKEEHAELVSEIVSNEVRELSERVDDCYVRLEELHLEVLEASNNLKIKQFPSQRAIESQLQREFESFGEFKEFRDQLLGYDPDSIVRAPLQFGRSLWQFVRHAPEERTDVDLNSIVAASMLVNSQTEIQLSEVSPMASAHPADLSAVIFGTQAWVEDTIAKTSREYLKTLGEGNQIFEQIAQPGFLETGVGQYMMTSFLEPESTKVSVSDEGIVQIQMSVAHEIMPDVQRALAQEEGLSEALKTLAARNQIGFEINLADDGITIILHPITVGSSEESILEKLKALFPASDLGLTETDEFGIPMSDPLEDFKSEEEQHEEHQDSFVLLPRTLTTPDGERDYLIGVQGAAILSPEAGQQLQTLALRIDEYMKLLPDMKSAALQKITLKVPEGQEENMVIEDRFAMTLDEAYRKGKFDFITFGPEIRKEPNPEAWSSRITKALDNAFPWTSAEESLSQTEELEEVEETMASPTSEDAGTIHSVVTIDSATFHDDAVLESLQRMNQIGHFRNLSLYEDFLTKITENKSDSPISAPELLLEIESVTRELSSHYADERLTFSLGITMVPKISLRENMTPTLKFEAHDGDSHVVLKGHLDPESKKILYREVEPADQAELISRVSKAVHSLAEHKPLEKADVHDIVHALENEQVRISEMVTALALIGVTRKQNSQLDTGDVLKRMFQIPGIYVDRDASNVLTLKRYTRDELRSSS